MVTILIVNYNGERLIADCLQCLEGQTFQEFDIVIVENGSSDRSCIEIDRFLEKSLLKPRVRVVLMDDNLGFAGGNIEGLRYVTGDFVVLLNNDTLPEQSWLEELVRVAMSDSRAGICASKLISYDAGVIDSAGDGYTRSLKGFKRGEGEAPDKFDKRIYVFGACAGAALYRRAMLDEVGFFDEDFFLIHEDTDLNLRAKLAGWKILFVPTAIVYHKVTSSIGYMSKMQVYHTLRNSELVRMKNIPLPVLLICLPELLLGFISEFIFFGLKHGHVRLFLKAKRDAIKLLPKMMKKRREIMARKRISNRALLHEMTPIWDKGFFKVRLRKLLHG